MTIRLGLLSLWLQRRWILLLVLMVSIITGFCAILPLYMEQLIEASTQHIVADLSHEKASIVLYNPAPIDPGVETVLNDILGDLFTREIRYSRATGPSEAPTLEKICGYEYTEGEPLTANTHYAYTPAEHCYILYSFDLLPDIFRLTTGDWPQVLDPPVTPDFPEPLIMGEGQIEAVISTTNAEQTGLAIGDRVVVGDHPDRAVTIEIVGFVEPVFDRDSVFWHSHGVALTGEWTPYGDDRRLDIGLIILEQVFAEWVPVITPNAYYAWWLNVPPATITANRLRTLDTDLDDVMQEVRFTHPDITLVSGLSTLSDRFDEAIAQYRGSVIVVFGAILLWFTNQLAATAMLIFADRRAEWAILVQHGATRRQVMNVMLLSLTAIGVVGVIIGIVCARPLLAAFGPASLPEGSTAQTDVVLFSWGGATLASVALGFAAWNVSGRKHLHTALPHNAPPENSAWSRYYVDLLLLAGGIAMTARLYMLIGDDLQYTLRDLLYDPVALTRQVAMSNTPGTRKLDDPANLIGPLMIAVGAALVCFRAILLVMRVPARLVARRRTTIWALAFWRVVRDPGRYGLLVITLIATSLLAASSAILDATRESAAWSFAHNEVGADARLTVHSSALPDDLAWTRLPGVTRAAPVMYLRAGTQSTSLYGIIPEAMPAMLPDFPMTFTGLTVPADALPGVQLPEDTNALQLQIYSETRPENPGEFALDFVVLDSRGVAYYAPLVARNEHAEQFVTLRASLAALADETRWRLMGIRMSSTHINTHTFFIDDIAAVDEQGIITVLDDFETMQDGRWTASLDQSINMLEVERSTEQASHGNSSQKIALYVKYTRVADLRPVLLTVDNLLVEIPVIVSEAFAAKEQKRLRSEVNVGVGDTGLTRLDLPLGTFSLAYRIIGIVGEFPTVSDKSFVIAPFEAIRMVTNFSRTKSGVYDANQIWLDLDERALGVHLRTAVQDIPGVSEPLYANDRYFDLRTRAESVAISGVLHVGSAVAGLLSLLIVIAFLTLRFSARTQGFRIWFKTRLAQAR